MPTLETLTIGRRVAALALTLALTACAGRNDGSTLAPADPDALQAFAQGARFVQRGTPAGDRRARPHFERALELDEDLWEAHYNLGVIERRAGRLAEARAQFEAAARVVPDEHAVGMALAEVRFLLGDTSGAAAALEAVIEEHPDDLDARVALASVLRREERYERALRAAREVLVRDASRVDALIEIARVYAARDRMEVAELVLSNALALVPDDAPTLRARVFTEQGLVALRRGDTQAAFDAFAQAVESDPHYAPARRNKGAVLLRAGDYEGAAAELQALLRDRPDDLDAKVALGAAMRGLGRHARARRLYREVLRVDEAHLGALFNLAVLEADFLDQRPRARERFVRFLSLAPPNHPKREEAQRYVSEIEPPPTPSAPAEGTS